MDDYDRGWGCVCGVDGVSTIPNSVSDDDEVEYNDEVVVSVHTA